MRNCLQHPDVPRILNRTLFFTVFVFGPQHSN